MPYRVDIYIGSDNGSRKISKKYLERIREWACSVFPEGYTLLKGTGYYQNSSEESLIVNVLSGHDLALKQHHEQLKRELKQEVILLVKSSVDLEVV